jgi:hypothetical protein
VPESPRWLIGNGHLDRAKEGIRRAAKANGREVPEHLLKNASIEVTSIESRSFTSIQQGAGEEEGKAAPKATVLDLFRTRTMALRTSNMCFQVHPASPLTPRSGSA